MRQENPPQEITNLLSKIKNPNHAIVNHETINWLASRYPNTTAYQYLNPPAMLAKLEAIAEVFKKYDEDGSGKSLLI